MASARSRTTVCRTADRILFEPEIALGYRVSERLALEASYLHISHATIFGDQNPGLTDIGVRAVYRFGG